MCLQFLVRNIVQSCCKTSPLSFKSKEDVHSMGGNKKDICCWTFLDLVSGGAMSLHWSTWVEPPETFLKMQVSAIK